MKIVSKWTELEKILLSKMTRPRKKKEKKNTFFLICGPSSNSSELSVQHGETTETRKKHSTGMC